MKTRQILLFTDFGWRGPYLGQMLSVLYAAAPQAVVIPVQSDAPAMDPRRSAYLLPPLVRRGPADAVWVCVVDPGVGGERSALVAEADGRWLVGPDNGLLWPTLQAAAARRVWRLDWRPEPLSASFHGRDLFAPAAACLARGERPPSTSIAESALAGAGWPVDLWEIIYVDAFGNAVTGIRAGSLGPSQSLEVNGQQVSYTRTFCAAAPGQPFWYVNSLELVEIAVSEGRADVRMSLSPGSAVRQAP